MRIRNIKPEFFRDDEICELSLPARLIFIGLWCMADAEGRLEERPKAIKAGLAPLDDWDIEAILYELAEREFIVRYDGTKGDKPVPLIWIPRFNKHQWISKKERDTPSELSEYQGVAKSLVPALVQSSSSTSPEQVEPVDIDIDIDIDKDTPPAAPPDPLKDLPLLKKAVPRIFERIKEKYEKFQAPIEGTSRYFNSVKVLGQLVTIDGYSQQEVLETFTWVFTSEHKDALFWRRQVRGLQQLRKRDDGLSKFDNINEAYKNTLYTPHTPRRTAEDIKKELFA